MLREMGKTGDSYKFIHIFWSFFCFAQKKRERKAKSAMAWRRWIDTAQWNTLERASLGFCWVNEIRRIARSVLRSVTGPRSRKRWKKNFSQELSHALHNWTDTNSHPRSEWALLALNIFRHYTHKCCYHRPRHHACCRDVVTHTWELSARRDRGDEFMYSAADAEFSLFSVFFLSLGLDTRECCVHTDDDARRKTRGEKAKKKKNIHKKSEEKREIYGIK